MKKITFVGSKILGVRVLEEMYRIAPDNLSAVITIDDSQDTRCALDSYQQFSQRANIPLRILSKGSELGDEISKISPDLCIVAGWYWVLGSEVLKMAPGGWVGIHASLLPKYRGGAPLVWAIINGETESGVSLFYFDEGMDTGNLLAQAKFDIEFEDTIADVLQKTEVWSIEMIQETYPLLIRGTATSVAQDHSQASYAGIRKPDDGRIDWNATSIQLYNFIRAQTQPYPGAFCQLESGDILRIWEAKVFPHPYFGSPGQVVAIEPDHVVVACGTNGAIRLQNVQLGEGKEQNANEILKFGQRLN